MALNASRDIMGVPMFVTRNVQEVGSPRNISSAKHKGVTYQKSEILLKHVLDGYYIRLRPGFNWLISGTYCWLL
jgi:hypothetical protein